MLVLSLGLVLIMIGEARKPKYWRWLLTEPQASQPNALPGRDDAATPDRTPSPDAQKTEADHSTGLPKTSAAAEAPGGKYFPGVRPELLAAIRDKTRFRVEEQDAWFHLFAVLESADPTALGRGSIGRVARIQLSEQSEAYRGELVSVRGVIRRAHWLAAPKNDYGIDGYYQAWVQPDENPKWPIVVYCLDWPKGFTTGMDLWRPVDVTGFSFKRWSYESNEGLQLAPVILARGVDPRLVGAASDVRLPLGGWTPVVVVVVAVLVAATIVSYVYRRTFRGQTEPRP